MQGCNEYIIEQALLVLPLAILAKYGGDASKVDLDFIISHGQFRRTPLPDSDSTNEDDEAARTEAEKTTFLQEYGFIRCSEFDLAIINLVKKGYADEDLIKKVVEGIEREIQHNKDVALLRDAWKIYNSSFQDNESEVLLAFENAIKVGLGKFSLEDVDSVAYLYRGFGRDAEIQVVIDKFFSEIYPSHGVTDRDDIIQWPSNPYVRQSLESFFDGLVFKGSFSEFMQAAFENPNNTYEIIKGLANKDGNEFYNYFSSLNDQAFNFHARLLLKLGNTSFSNQDDALIYRDIFIKTFEALKELSETTTLNKLRMGKFMSYEPMYLRDLKRIQIEEKEAAEAAAAPKIE